MTAAIINNGTTDELQRDNEALRVRLREVEETLNAIRRGEVDSLVAQTPEGPRVFTLVDANTPYRTFVEEMQHGAATIGPDGTILFCNSSLPALLRTPIERVVGSAWHTVVADESADASKRLLAQAAEGKVNAELNLRAADGTLIPVSIVANPPSAKRTGEMCLVITDLTRRKRAEAETRRLTAIVKSTEAAFVGKMPDSFLAGSPSTRSALQRYGVAVVAVIAAFLIRLIFWPFLGATIPFLLHFPAVIVAAWYGGFRAGLLATLLSAIGTLFFILEPRWTFMIANPAEIFGTALFILLGAGLSFLLDYAKKGMHARLKSEAETRATQVASAYHRSLIEASLDPLVVNGPDGKITDVNVATEQVTGRTRQELIGSDFIDYFTEPDKARQLYKQAFREGSVRDFSLEIRHKDGRLIPVLYNASVYRDEAGEVLGVFAAARDITERKRAEEALQKQAALLELSHDAILLHEPTDLITYWNRAAEVLYGWTREEAMGQRTHMFLQTTFPQPLEEIETLLLQQGYWEGELEHVTRHGNRITVASRWSLARDEHGNSTGLLEINSDITGQKRAEQELRRAAAYTRSLIEASVDPLVTIGPDGKITDVNAATEQATGCARAQLIGTDFADYFTEPDKAREGYQQVFREGAVRDYPLEIHGINEHTTPVLYNASVYRDEEGKVTGVFAAARDISQRKQVEDSLRLSEARYRSLVVATSQVVWTTDADGKITEDLPSWTAYTGQSADEIRGSGWVNALHPDDRARTRTVWEEAVANRTIYETEYRFRRHDGEYRVMLARGAPVREENGDIREWVGTCTDITERKRAEEALTQSEAASRTMTESLPQLVWMCTPDGLNVYFNQRWVDYTGLSLAESYGTGWNKPFHTEDRQRAWDAWKHTVDSGGAVPYQIECRLRKADGSYHWFLIKGVPLRDDGGPIIKWFGTCTDIDDLKQAEAALAQRAVALERSNKELEQFAYVASHDLQEPLRMIASYVELLAQRYQGQIDDKADKFIHYIVDGATRMQTLINDLLAFSRVATRGKPFTLTSAETALADVVVNLQKLIADKGALVTHEPLPDVVVDPTQFQQVLQNLIGNGLKFCERRPLVHIRAERQGDDWLFSVRDNGIGIAKEHMDRLFVIFQRLHTRTEYPGTGIGLAVTKKVIERHGGRIWVESEPGKGSTFYFTIPVNREQT